MKNGNDQVGTHSSRRVNAILSGRRDSKYLEIGVNKGRTFFAVDAKIKIAVDPNFRFNTNEFEAESVRFHPTTSDEFFKDCPSGEMFDLIFLDGLHTFEQTLRDLMNSFGCAKKDTVWVIDDTVPMDVFSSWPDQQAAVRYRKREGKVPTRAWQGDVYKVVYFIHDFIPSLSYLTINTGGNAQTLVWRRSRAEFRPRFGNLEAISRLTYLDFRRNPNIMNFMSEEEGLQKVRLHLLGEA